MTDAIEKADRMFGPKPDDWCGRIACPDWGATYPESEALTEFINLFNIGPLDVAKLLVCRSNQDCQIEVLKESRSDIAGGSLDAINDAVLGEVLVWAGAISYESCGTSGSGATVYCVATSRLPARESGPDAMTLGSFILYDITEPNTNYLQPDGSYSLVNSRPELLAHELGHVSQWDQFGSDFMWLYLFSPDNWECLANAATGTTAGAC
jgi:hypothetical protein